MTVALLVAGVTMTGCKDNNDPQEPAKVQTYKMSINASKGAENNNQANGPRKVLGLDGNTLNASWAAGERVTVYNVTKDADLGGYLEAQSSGASTTLLGDLTGAIEAGDVLTLKFLSADYANQEGTLEYISANCDYATASTTVSSVDGGTIYTEGTANFANQQAVVKFSLKDKGNGDAAIPAIVLYVYADGNIYTVTPTAATDELFVAIPAISSQDVTLIATDGEDYFLYEKTGVTFDNSQYYTIGVKMEESALARPLTFKAMTAGATITFTKGSSFTGNVQYSTDCGKTWADYSSAITLTNVGDKVLFRGNNSTYYSGSASKFSCGGDCYLYGNIMSLVSSMNYLTTNSFGNTAFREMFKGNSHLKSHATKHLILPAATLTGSCYQYMFQNCTGLTTPPLMLATSATGGNNCNGMFNGCTALTSLPELHLTNLGNYCFQGAFSGCTSLTSVPENYLPFTTLTPACYMNMFQNCTGLTNVPNLPATSLQPRCYYNMFNGCTSLTALPSNLLPATTLAVAQESKGCYEGMFMGCTGLTSVPNLPATVLTERCYLNMFRGAGMTTVPNNMLGATTMANSCCASMFRECPNLTNTPEIFATTLAESCCDAMFYHSAKITSAAPLHATTLVTNCYKNLFNGCSLLASVTCYATDISAENCTNIWLADAGKDVTGTKTIYTPSTTAWPNNTSGIPSGWTRVNL